MKFFRKSAPWLVALVLLLCAVPAFAAEASDSVDTYEPETGEVLTGDSGSSAPADDPPAYDPPVSSGGDTAPDPPASPDNDPVPDPPASSGGDDPAVDPSDPDSSDPDGPDSDGPAVGGSSTGSGGGGSGASGGFGSILGGIDSITCSGSTVTVNLDDRSYTSTTNVDDSSPFAMDDPSGEASADSLTLSGFLRAMFGEYTPKTQTVVTYFDGQRLDVTTEYVPGVAGMDMEWIASVILFGLVLYCLFRLLGGMVR